MKTIDQLAHPHDITMYARGRNLTQADAQKLLKRLEQAHGHPAELRLARATVVAASARSRQ